MRRVVLDTSVVVAAFRSRRGVSNQVLVRVAERRLVPLATTALFLEYESVLQRPDHRAAHGLSAQDVETVLAELAALCEPVEVHFRWRPQALDPGDDFVIEAAANGRADGIVTHNLRHLSGPAARFGLPVVTPGALIESMRP